ncbi:MAG: RagB/SusD family nutrient uptake outer membrane protein [Marinilabiliaceae bacterium]|nr:RagB/SusD family nutrient uptake outer membrane protein [Marinilabiliaceae bacterium]
MKTTIKILPLAAILGFMSPSCSEDFITTPQNGVEDLDNYFATAEECEAFTGSLYVGFSYWHDWWQQLLRLINETATDDAWMGNLGQDNSAYYPFAHYTVTATNTPDGLYNFYYYKYQNISAANTLIKRIQDSPVSETVKNQCIGQAKFFRAYSYWELVQNFGDVVLLTEPIGTSGLGLARSPKADVYAQIVKDLKEAAELLPSEWTGVDKGRVTSGACEALLARTYLFMGDYENAYTYADKVINSGRYALEEDFINIWSVYNHNGKESIFEIQANSNQTYAVGARIPTVTAARGEVWSKDDLEAKKAMDGWGWCVPTSNLEQAYISEGDDIRRKSTIVKYGEPVYGDEDLNPEYKFKTDDNKSCRVWRKFYVPIAMRQELAAAGNIDGKVPLDLICIRLAEMYLTRAEAAYYKGETAQALADINTIRARVGLSAKTGISGNDLLYAIWKERRLELAGEGMRLYDLRREIDPVQNKPRIACVMGENGEFVRYNATSTDEWEVKNTKEPSNEGHLFVEGRHELWPIPQAEIDRSNGSISQNPGY